MSTSATLPDLTDQPGEFAEDVHPGDIQTPDTPFTYGENNRDLPDQLKHALDALVKKFQLRDMYDRRIEVLTDRIMRLYDDGVQHVYPNYATGVYQIGVAGGYVDLGNGESYQCPEYMGSYNIFRARRRSLDAVLTQNPPGIDFRPDDPSHSEDQEASEAAEAYRHYFDQANDIRQMQQDIARMFELSGRCVALTETVANKQRWGDNDQGEPRKMETVKVYGTLESKVPIICKDRERALYCFLYNDPDVLTAKANHNHIRSQIKPGEAGLGESDWERFARLGVKQAKKGYYLTGSALAHLVTEMAVFMRPAAFEDETCDEAYLPTQDDEGQQLENEDGSTYTVRDRFKAIFPEGVRATYVGTTYSESWSVSMDDAIDIGFPTERDGMSGGALMEPMKVIQDAYNDAKNAERENYDKGWPATYFKGSSEDYDAIIDQQSGPRKYILLKESNPDAQIQGQIMWKEPDMQVPDTFVAYHEDLRGAVSQDVTGALPALAGKSEPDQTASGQAMDRSQAMGMLGPAWANMQRMFAGIYYKAALLAAKNPDHNKPVTVIGGQGTNVTLTFESLTKGKFYCHPDVDSTFPESTAAKRANLTQIMTMIAQSPQIAAMFLQSPDNWEEVLELLGFPELVLTPAMAYRKQTREIEILIREAPVQQDPEVIQQAQVDHATQAIQAQQSGMPPPPFQPPPPMISSVPVEPDDFHQWESMKCAEYLSSEDCWRQQVEGNTDGIQNIRLHKAAHDQFLAQAAMAQAQMQAQAAPAQQGPPPPHKAAAHAPEAKTQVQKNAGPPGAPGQSTL